MSSPGFSLAWFVETPSDELVCGLCRNVLNDPHQCMNGHMFCKQCLQICANCPVCDVSLIETKELPRCNIANKMINRLIVKCSCENGNCDWTGPLSERFKQHCDFAVVTCPNQGCWTRIESQFMARHLIKCERRAVRCEFCLDAHTAKHLPRHKLTCNLRTIRCDCGTDILWNQMDSHVFDDCNNATVHCPLFQLGCCGQICSGSLQRHEWSEHFADQTDDLTVRKRMMCKLVELLEFRDSAVEQLKSRTPSRAVRPPKKVDEMVVSECSSNGAKLGSKDHPILVELPTPPIAHSEFSDDQSIPVKKRGVGRPLGSIKAASRPIKEEEIDESYVGERNSAGQKHGKGKLTNPRSKGCFYDGDWVDDKRHGQGKCHYVALKNRHIGGVYVGAFVNDKRQGHGVCTFENGDVYTGNWSGSKRSGQGRMVYADGRVYEGRWVNNQEAPSAQKRTREPPVVGSSELPGYDGAINSAGQRHGHGTQIYNQGKDGSYVGEWFEDKRHGQGTLQHPDMETYTGEFMDDIKHGYGVTTYDDGNVHTGQWVGGKRHGRGKMSYWDGTEWKALK